MDVYVFAELLWFALIFFFLLLILHFGKQNPKVARNKWIPNNGGHYKVQQVLSEGKLDCV